MLSAAAVCRHVLLRVHRAAVAHRHPAADDPVDEPEPDHADGQPRDDDADAERRDDEQHAESDPEQPVPERPDLPAEVRLEPGATRLAAFHVVEDDRDDRRPAGEEGADHRGGAEQAGEQTEGVQRIDRLRPGDERARRLLHVTYCTRSPRAARLQPTNVSRERPKLLLGDLAAEARHPKDVEPVARPAGASSRAGSRAEAAAEIRRPRRMNRPDEAERRGATLEPSPIAWSLRTVFRS